jgi:putative peptidoglycan lipid II flippase
MLSHSWPFLILNPSDRKMNFNVGSSNIFKAAGIVSIGTIIVGAFTLLKDVIVGMNFGASAEMDSMLLAYSIPFFLGTVALAVVQATLIPLYSQVKMEGDHQQLPDLVSKVFTLTGAILVGAALLLYLAAPLVIRLMAHDNFTQEQLRLSIILFCLFLPIIPLMGLYGLFGGIFYAEKQFFLPTLIAVTTPVVTVICILLGKEHLDIISLGVGISLGWLIQVLIIRYQFSRFIFPIKLNLNLRDNRIHKFLSLSWPLFLGAFFSGSIIIIDRIMAASLPTGSISALDYADRINILAIGAFGVFQTAVFPYFSDHVSHSNYKQLVGDFKRTVLLLCLGLAPVVLLAIFYRYSLVALLFQRGEFDLKATILTGQAAGGYFVGMIPLMIGMIAVRMAQALNMNRFIGFQGTLNPAFKIILNLLLIPIFGHMGIALATSGMYTIGAIIVLVGVFRHLQVMPTRSDVVPYLKIAISLLGLSGVVLLLRGKEGIVELAVGHNFFERFLVILIGGAVYWAGCYLLGLTEAREITREIWKMCCSPFKLSG